jgi:hypothetical protein
VDANVYNYYNKNMADVRGKTLYVVEDELAREINTEAKIKAVYPYKVKIVDRETIKELIIAEDEDAVVLHKVGPESRDMNARVYNILIGAADARFYYFDYHKVTDNSPDAFLPGDLKKLARATK